MNLALRLKSECTISPRVATHLKLTPLMRRSIDILQLPTPELRSLLERELIENPLLEEDIICSEEESRYRDNMDGFSDGLSRDYQEREYFYDRQKQAEANFLEEMLTQQTSLSEYLLVQLRMSNLSESEYKIGEMIIGNLDDNGYLRASVQEISTLLGMDILAVENVLSVIQAFDPPGVAARSLEECLLIQLRIKGRSDSLASLLVKGYLSDLKRKRYAKISRLTGVSIKEIRQACNEIALLEPKPGRNFGPQQATSIMPDVVLHRIEDNYWIEYRDRRLLQIRLSPFYKRLLRERNLPSSTKKYLREKFDSARWLMRAVKQRWETMNKIIECIINLQREFLDKGSLYLKPLRLKDVADMLGMHKSTISRAIAGKYIQTPQGTVEMRYFFDDGASMGEQSRAYRSIKAWIQNVVEEEDSRSPLSDEQIKQILQRQGVCISRRTIAKYRGQLRILPSYLRRQ